eukprot:4178698-Pleurochrysis_carterae.AAC.1
MAATMAAAPEGLGTAVLRVAVTAATCVAKEAAAGEVVGKVVGEMVGVAVVMASVRAVGWAGVCCDPSLFGAGISSGGEGGSGLFGICGGGGRGGGGSGGSAGPSEGSGGVAHAANGRDQMALYAERLFQALRCKAHIALLRERMLPLAVSRPPDSIAYLRWLYKVWLYCLASTALPVRKEALVQVAYYITSRIARIPDCSLSRPGADSAANPLHLDYAQIVTSIIAYGARATEAGAKDLT